VALSPDESANLEESESRRSREALRREVRTLRAIVRVFELESAPNEMVVEQFRQIARSRFYPLAVLLLKADVVLERLVRHRIGRPKSSTEPVANNDEPAASEGNDGPSAAPGPSARVAQLTGYAAKGVRLLRHGLVTVVRGPSRTSPSPQREANPYGGWVEAFDTPNEDQLTNLRRRVGLLTYTPLLSVVMATYNSDHRFLDEAIESVLAQIYENFELVIADDCSSDDEVRAIVRRVAKRDARVRLVERTENGGISAATNSAIAEATGEWLVFMDHDDTIASHALLHHVLAMNERPSAALLYSDEDKIDEDGKPFMPYFKSDFDPLLLLGQNYVCHLTAARRQLVAEVGGLRSEFDGSQDWDLVLRIADVVDRADIVHVPHVLYHWRSHSESTSKTSSAKPWALDAGRRAVSAALERRGVRAHVNEVADTGFAEVRFELPVDAPLVSIVIPTRDGKYLETCVTSVLSKTIYPNYEIVLVDNGSVHESTATFLAGLSNRVTVVRDDRPFNYPALHNAVLTHCKGDVLVLLNDDTEVIEAGWLSAMVAQLLQPGVGAVGAKLLYPDGRVQHAGVILGAHGVAAHVAQFLSRDDRGYFGRTSLASEFQACTAACLAVRRTTWEKAGGLDERFAVAWNDIDFCLRVRENGEFVTYTPLAQLVHHESATRGLDETGPRFKRFMDEIAILRERWGAEIWRDPYYNPNLCLSHALFELAYPPRVSPWYTGIE
jgi:glycosyltransferase involved in cell wall biosynthesis